LYLRITAHTKIHCWATMEPIAWQRQNLMLATIAHGVRQQWNPTVGKNWNHCWAKM